MAIVAGLAGMYATGTLWTPTPSLQDLLASTGEEEEEDDEEEEEEEAGEAEEGRDPPAAGRAGDIELTSVRVVGAGSALASTSQREEKEEEEEETHALLSSAPPPLSPVHSAYPSSRAAPVPRLPYRYFFAAPPFERRTFVRHLLCHLAAVVAWTGMWDLTDSIILPALSESCYNVPGFVNEYPCVLVKFAFVGLGALGLHWTGQLYYGVEERVEGELGGGLGADRRREGADADAGAGRGRKGPLRGLAPWSHLGLGGSSRPRDHRAVLPLPSDGNAVPPPAAARAGAAKRERLRKSAAAMLARLRKRRTILLSRSAGWRPSGGGGGGAPPRLVVEGGEAAAASPPAVPARRAGSGGGARQAMD